MFYAKVVVDMKNDQLNETYDYIIPEVLEEFVGVGSRVLVPFGMQKIFGYVIGLSGRSEYYKTAKEIIDCLDYDQELTEEQIELAEYISKQSHVSMVSVLELMIPSFLKGQSRKYIVVKDYDKLHPDLALLFKGKERLPIDNNIKEVFKLVKDEINKDNITIDYDYYTYGRGKKTKIYYVNQDCTLFRSEKRKIIYDYVARHKDVTIDDITNVIDCSYNLIREMVKEESLYTKEVVNLDKYDENEELKNSSNYKFSLDQDMTIQKYNISNNNKYLLFSNDEEFKAAFYLKVIEDAKKVNQPVLITAPTILLQEEILMYLKRNLKGYRINGITSKNTRAEKYETFMNIKYNNCDCVVTTQSGIFLPFDKLYACIIVEEENLNYINENYPYYRTIDCLKKRCEYFGAKLILSTSSPSINTYKEYMDGEYVLLQSFKDVRVNSKIIDMKQAILNGENNIISNMLKEAIKSNIELGKQVMLLVSSKAYAPILKCNDCGKVIKCPKCGIALTYYKDKNVAKCNYCDYKLAEFHKCSCGGDVLSLGFGQEQVSEVIQTMFEGASILNINADLMKKTEDYNQALTMIEENKVDIIIGTNILSKTVNSENIGLVAVIDIDSYLNNNSHRASELTYNFISKLTSFNNLIIQTYNSNNPIIIKALKDSYDEYYKSEIYVRKMLNYEPFYEMNRITITGDYKEIYHFANYFKKFYTTALKDAFILGPSYDYRIKGVKLILKHNDFEKVIKILDDTKIHFKSSRIYVNYERYPKVI